MRFHHVLDDVLGQRSKVRVLRHLLRVRGSHTGRQIAHGSGVHPPACNAALRDLVEQGLLDRRTVGRAYLYTLRAEHILVDSVLAPLFQSEGDLREVLRKDLTARIRTPVLSLLLHGSLARGEESPRSDIDLLGVVRASAEARSLEEELIDATGPILDRFGNPLQAVIWKLSELRTRRRREDPFLGQVMESGHLLLGSPLDEVR